MSGRSRPILKKLTLELAIFRLTCLSPGVPHFQTLPDRGWDFELAEVEIVFAVPGSALCQLPRQDCQRCTLRLVHLPCPLSQNFSKKTERLCGFSESNCRTWQVRETTSLRPVPVPVRVRILDDGASNGAKTGLSIFTHAPRRNALHRLKVLHAIDLRGWYSWYWKSSLVLLICYSD